LAIQETAIRRAIPSWRVPSMLRFRFVNQRSTSQWLLIATLLVYFAGCIVVYFRFVEPWVNGDSTVRVGADSDRYWDAVKLAQEDSSSSQLVTLGANFLGPVILGLLLKTGFTVMCFNFLLFWIALKVASSIEGVNSTVFGFLMVLNAELLPALTTLNKEILALLAAVLTAKYIYSGRRSIFLLLCTLVVSLLVRWEQLLIFVFFLLLMRSPLRHRPKLALATLVAALTVIYPLMFRIFGIDPSVFYYLIADAGLIVRLDTIQAAYGFPIVLPIKVLMLLAGRLVQPGFYAEGAFFKPHYVDFQQELSQPLGCIAILVVFTVALFKGKMRPQRRVALFSLISLIVASVAPFIQPRYAYPVYVLLSLELAKDTYPSLTQTLETQNRPLDLSVTDY
jgi:hypothetical protein